MFVTRELAYDYESNMDKPVKIRFVHSHENVYLLEFCLTDGSREKWNTLQTYNKAFSGDKPGQDDPTVSVYGNWCETWFYVSSPDDAREQLAKLKESLKTVGDIYDMYIEKSIERRDADMAEYERRQAEEKSLPDVLE